MWGMVLGLVALAVLGARLVYVFRRKQRQKAAATEFLFADVLEVVEKPVFEQRGADEFPRLSGTYRGFPVQIYPLVDTLATRRLPALWLMVTLQDKLPVIAHFDLMMRPAGPTTFSNFDHLPHTLDRQEGFPEQAVIRTDNAEGVLRASLLEPHLEPFFGPRAKELLITQNGLRIVWLLAEAERVRYGVLRQAEFGQVQIEGQLARDILDRLIAIRKDVLAWEKKNA
ncbi:MAG TPA: hypothetical protein VM144_03570 [Aestuariivirga sp.]|nr:hypothetical protein [Aestuariivirga sp.]